MEDILRNVFGFIYQNLHPYSFMIIGVGILYRAGYSVVYAINRKRGSIHLAKILLFAFHFGFSGFISFLGLILLMLNNANPAYALDASYWVIPLCSCPIPSILILVLLTDQALIRKRYEN